MAKLTDKQKKFVDEYLKDLNATQAATRAGYSEKNAFKIGSELLQKTTVKEYIDKRMKDRQARTEITQDRVLNELAKIGFANITDYLEVKEIDMVTGYEKDENGEPDLDRPKTSKFKTVDVYETARVHKEKLGAIAEIKQTRDGIAIKMHDKVKALEDIAKHLGMFVEKVEHSGSIEVKKLEDFFK